MFCNSSSSSITRTPATQFCTHYLRRRFFLAHRINQSHLPQILSLKHHPVSSLAYSIMFLLHAFKIIASYLQATREAALSSRCHPQRHHSPPAHPLLSRHRCRQLHMFQQMLLLFFHRAQTPPHQWMTPPASVIKVFVIQCGNADCFFFCAWPSIELFETAVLAVA
jgi:hypothetical protein